MTSNQHINNNLPIETDALIIGAGPVGLFQVFELGLLEIKTHVVDALCYPGGQCVELYPDKPIYDIPAIPCCTGQQLTENLLKQIEPFAPQFHFGHEVKTIEQQADGAFFVQTAKNLKFITKTIFIAAGVGAFQPQRLRVANIEQFENSQLFYSVKQPSVFAGKDLVIVGGGDSAIDWTLEFVKDSPHKANSVTLLHRRDGFQAAPANIAKMRQLCQELEMQFLVGQITDFQTNDKNKLVAIKVLGPDAITRILPLDMLLVFFGLSPKLGPIANWGLQIERKQLVVDTEKFSTSVKGIFAVGDINNYPGKKKLILSGFHETALAAYGAMEILKPQQHVTLQYTTTSPKVHKILGVDSPVFD